METRENDVLTALGRWLAPFVAEHIVTSKAPRDSAALNRTKAAEYLGISRPTLNKMIKGGELSVVEVGGTERLRVRDLDAYLARRVGNGKRG